MIPPAAPDPNFPRLTGQPFPPHRFLPGQGAPMRRHPAGQAVGPAAPASPQEWRAVVADWRRSAPYCFGVDLYNYAYWWEAHEAWEPLWRGAPPDDPRRRVLQAFIQVSAAHLQRHRDRQRGVRLLLARAGANLAAARPAGDVQLGVTFPAWWTEQVLPHFERRDGAVYPFLAPTGDGARWAASRSS